MQKIDDKSVRNWPKSTEKIGIIIQQGHQISQSWTRNWSIWTKIDKKSIEMNKIQLKSAKTDRPIKKRSKINPKWTKSYHVNPKLTGID